MNRRSEKFWLVLLFACVALLVPCQQAAAQGDGGWPVSMANPVVHSATADVTTFTVKTPFWWLQLGDGGWINVPGGGGGGHHLIQFVAAIPEGGGITFVLANGGSWSASLSAAPTVYIGPQGLTIGFNDPGITTKWHSAKGDHEVYTPCASTTPAGLKRCADEHEAMVTIMQAKYPPI